jgi:AraC-like DNA-binding protein
VRQAVAYFFEEDRSVSRAQAITAGILKAAALGGYTSYIARAIERLNQDFDQPLRIEGIANELGMSVSEFHHHFKAVTALSPLQFQKRLRLQEDRRLMLGEGLDATSAGIRVGYGSPSQFSREYHRLFGAPPLSDIARLRKGMLSTDNPCNGAMR